MMADSTGDAVMMAADVRLMPANDFNDGRPAHFAYSLAMKSPPLGRQALVMAITYLLLT